MGMILRYILRLYYSQNHQRWNAIVAATKID